MRVCVRFTLERERQMHNPECVQEVLVLTDGRRRGGSEKKKKWWMDQRQVRSGTREHA